MLTDKIEQMQYEARELIIGTGTNTIPDDDWHTALYEDKASKINKVITQTAVQTLEVVIDDIVFIEPIDDGDDDLPSINAINAINVYKQFLLRQLRTKLQSLQAEVEKLSPNQ